MDALSSSAHVSNLIFASHYQTSRELHHFKTSNYNLSSPTRSHFSSSSSCKPSSVSNYKPTSPFAVPFQSSSSSSKESSSKQFKPSTTTHFKAASGYAAALVDAAKCNNSLEAVAKDVQRLSKWLRNEQLCDLEEIERGQVLLDIAKKGRFHKNLVVMLKLLVSKNKLGLVTEVLLEFRRIYDELTGTCVLLVSSTNKMDKDELFGIARSVGKLSGAFKVKVRHVFNRKLPSMATQSL